MQHPIHDIAYKTPAGLYRMVVEIAAGTNEKWQTDPHTGAFYHDVKDGVPRVMNFLPYPFNYGFIPQTSHPLSKGGDGDPMDILTLAPAQPRGTVCEVNVIGAFKLVTPKEHHSHEEDTKVIATVPGGPFADVAELSDLFIRYPGAIEIIRLWFDGYKGPGAFVFKGYAEREEAISLIEESHRDWLEEHKA